jgi:hypothetical protein
MFITHTYKLTVGNLGGGMVPTLIYKNHCSSPWYSHETLFIQVLFIETTDHSTIIENTDIIHNIPTVHIGTIHYSYRHQVLSIS